MNDNDNYEDKEDKIDKHIGVEHVTSKAQYATTRRKHIEESKEKAKLLLDRIDRSFILFSIKRDNKTNQRALSEVVTVVGGVHDMLDLLVAFDMVRGHFLEVARETLSAEPSELEHFNAHLDDMINGDEDYEGYDHE